MRLSGRLSKILEIMQDCRLLMDIGCDHGYVCIEAVKKKKAEYAIAADTAEGPLQRARLNICEAGLSDCIDTLLSDGFKALDKDVRPDCVNITGMGGRLIMKILKEGAACGVNIAGIPQLILGPQSETEVLRHYLTDEAGLTIAREYCIFDDDKYYMLLDVRSNEASGPAAYSEADYLYGRNIDEYTMDTYREYILSQKEKLCLALERAALGAHSGDNVKKQEELRHKLALLEEKLSGL